MARTADAALLSLASMIYTPASAEPAFDWGFNLREQWNAMSPESFEAGASSSDSIWQHRAQVHADTRLDALRVFAELGVQAQNGRNGGPSPVDESALDLMQGFVELSAEPVPLRLRAGRQEWSLGSGRLVSVRDGPNIRRAFDAVQIEGELTSTRILALWGRPVENDSGAFDDRADRDQSLGGLYATLAADSGILAADLYWLSYRRKDASFSEGQKNEQRSSFGLRIFGHSEALDYNSEIVWQEGRWGSERIRAWTLANDFGWTLSSWRFQPRLGLKANLASGDSDPHDGQLQTFNALYPNPSYFSDAALIAPANLIDVQPNLRITLPHEISLHAGWNAIWKHRRNDAIYTTPVPLTPVAGSVGSARFVGQQWQLSAEWSANEYLDVEASYVHFDAGRGLRQAGGRSLDFLQVVLSIAY